MNARRRQYALWAALVVALLGLTAAALWNGPSARLGRSGGSAGRIVVPGGGLGGLDDYGALPDFGLVSQTGDSVHLRDLQGTVWIADFIFTHCAASCPMMTAQLARLDKGLAGQSGIKLVSFSVDPERDTPARLTEYASGYGATPDRWLFLTGDKMQIRRLSVQGFHLAVDDPSPADLAQGAEAVLHSTRLALVDGRGHVRGYYEGTNKDAVKQLSDDVAKLRASTPP